MPLARSNRMDLSHDTVGAFDHPAMLPVTGMGEQMLGRPEEFCPGAAVQGFEVLGELVRHWRGA